MSRIIATGGENRRKNQGLMLCIIAIAIVMAVGLALFSADAAPNDTNPYDIGEEFEVGENKYKVISDSEVSLTGTDRHGSGINIPDYVTYKEKTYAVVEIGENAFFGYEGYATYDLIIPSTVKKIGMMAFSEAKGIYGQIVIPDSVTQISAYAFMKMEGDVHTLFIGNGLTKITEAAFAECFALTGSVWIGDKVESIGKQAFDNCFNLKYIHIGESVSSIKGDAFGNCSSLTGSLRLPSSITKIEDYSFCNTGFSIIYIADGAKGIMKDAFMDCKPSTVYIPSSLTFSESADPFTNIKFYSADGSTELKHDSATLSGHAYSIKNGKLTQDVVPDQHKVTISSGVEECKVYGAGTYYEGETVLLYTIHSDLYTVKNWLKDGTQVQKGMDYYVDTLGKSDASYAVNFTGAEATIHFDKNGGSKDIGDDSQEYGTMYTLPGYSGTKEGYYFDGWDYKGKTYKAGDEVKIDAIEVTFVAHWTVTPKHHVTYDVRGGTGAEVPTQEDVAEGSTFKAASYDGKKEGYVFSGWKYDNKVYKPNDTVTMGKTDIKMKAIWTPLHKVSYDNNGGDTEAPKGFSIKEGKKFKVADYDGKKAGYEFAGWSCDGKTYAPGAEVKMGKTDMKFVAIWAENPSHNIDFDVNGGDKEIPSTVGVEGRSYEVPGYDGKKAGYEFIGWSNGERILIPHTMEVMPNHDVKLTALWLIRPDHKVSYDENGGDKEAPEGFSINEGMTFTVAGYDGKNEGYYFAGWSCGGTTYAPGAVVMMGKTDMKFVAIWEESPSHIVSYDVNGGDKEVPSSIVIEGCTYTVPGYDGSKEGCYFIGWSYQKSLLYPGTSVIMGDSDVTLIAIWGDLPVHKVRFFENGGSTPAPQEFENYEGAVFMVPDYEGKKEGYEFIGWKCDGEIYVPGTYATVSDHDMIFVAEWSTSPSHKVYYDVDGGSIQIPTKIVYEGATYYAPTYEGVKEGYVFVGWYFNGGTEIYAPGTKYVMEKEDIYLKVAWEAIPSHKVSFNTDGGTLQPESFYVCEGAMFTIPLYEGVKEGYHFGGWSYEGKTYAPGTKMVMGEDDIEFVAVWNENPSHVVSFNVDGGSKQIPSEMGVEGVTYIIPGYDGKKAGFTFDGWESNSDNTRYHEGDKAVMGTSDVILTIVWKANPVPSDSSNTILIIAGAIAAIVAIVAVVAFVKLRKP